MNDERVCHLPKQKFKFLCIYVLHYYNKLLCSVVRQNVDIFDRKFHNNIVFKISIFHPVNLLLFV